MDCVFVAAGKEVNINEWNPQNQNFKLILFILFSLIEIPANPRFGVSRNTTFNRYSNHYNSSYPVIMQSNRPDVLLNQTKDISSPPSYDEVMNMSINMQKK